MVAEMPGYARMDLISGTLYWQYTDPHGHLAKLDRREAANFFLDIEVPYFDRYEDLPPEPLPVRPRSRKTDRKKKADK